MITLCGFSLSNYYNIVKHTLLEKGIAFTEEHVLPRSKEEAVLSASPLGKVPFIKTTQGALCESAVILDYLEDQYPAHPLLPKDAFEAAKVREMITFINLHLELVARELYGQAFFGGTVSDELKANVKKQLVRNIEAFKRLVKFSPFIAGDTFTLADCVAFSNLPLVGMSTRGVLGEDLLLAAGIDYKPYIKMLGERESSQRIAADRKAAATKP
jgi:glutathione S-transferase